MLGGLLSGEEGGAEARGGAVGANGGGVGADGVAQEEPADTMDLLRKFDVDYGKRSGQAGIYTNDKGEKVAVSDATHYAYRADELRCFNAAEFNLVFDVRKMTDKDVAAMEKADAAAAQLQQEGHGEEGNGEVGGGEGAAPKRKAGRPKTFFRLCSAHPLAKSHLVVRRHK